jgi:hypothetical protein
MSMTCTEPQVAENGVGISQLHQILLHGLALLRPCTRYLQLTARLMRMRIICQIILLITRLCFKDPILQGSFSPLLVNAETFSVVRSTEVHLNLAYILFYNY